jgi:hypothetical protein
MSGKALPEVGVPHDQQMVTFTRRSNVGFYNFTIDIQFAFGLDLPLLCTNNEKLDALTSPIVGKPREIHK